jgi:hypothetical protein
MLFAAACSDTNDPTTSRRSVTAPSEQFSTPVNPLDAEIQNYIRALFPTGLETAAGVRWDVVKASLDAGKVNVAQSQYFNLVDWITKKEDKLDQPAGLPGETTVQHATAQLVFDMSQFLFNGATEPVHLGSDATVGFVTPTTSLRLVTPTTFAGLWMPVGSAPTAMTIVINKIETPVLRSGTGPLPYFSGSQWPLFYQFEPFPYVTLNAPATFMVCQILNGGEGLVTPPSREIDEELRVAHQDPGPGARIPGGQIVDGIEILPLKDVTSLPQPLPVCEGKDTSYPLTQVSDISANPFRVWLHNQGMLALRGLTHAGKWLLTPQDAYAIDAGGGGEALAFSIFGIVLPPGEIDVERVPGSTAVGPTTP